MPPGNCPPGNTEIHQIYIASQQLPTRFYGSLFSVSGKDYEMCLDRNLLQLFYLIMAILALLALVSLVFVCCLARKVRVQTRKLESNRIVESADSSTFGGSCASSRRIPSEFPGYASSGANYSQGGTLRSQVSELAGPIGSSQAGWLGSFPEHSIPRVPKIM